MQALQKRVYGKLLRAAAACHNERPYSNFSIQFVFWAAGLCFRSIFQKGYLRPQTAIFYVYSQHAAAFNCNSVLGFHGLPVLPFCRAGACAGHFGRHLLIIRSKSPASYNQNSIPDQPLH
eukprot:1161205-Pelagomonas_calceolata.AAC.7